MIQYYNYKPVKSFIYEEYTHVNKRYTLLEGYHEVFTPVKYFFKINRKRDQELNENNPVSC